MQKSDYRNMWVYIEHDGVTAAPVGLELCCEVRHLCDTTGDRLYAVIIGSLPDKEVEKVKECGIDGLIYVSGTGYEYFNTDAYANAFTVLSRKYNPSAIFVGGTINGRDFAPRFAVQLDTGCTSDAMELKYDPETGDIQFIEPAVGGKIMAVITVPVLRPQVGTIRPGTFKYAPTGVKGDIEIVREEINFDPESIRCRHIDFIPDEEDPEMDIANADSRILKDPAPFVELGALADSSVNFTVRLWVKTADYWGVWFNMNRKVYEEFNKRGIGFPFPQIQVHQS